MSNKTMKDIKIKKTPRGHEYPVGYELFYEDENGNLQDADIERAKRLGLTRYLAHMKKYSPEYFVDD